MKKRCEWGDSHPLYVDYHDKVWGVPVHDDRRLFEMLSLEGAQAGLSWLTILKKAPAYRKAFDRFSIKKVAAYTQRDVKRLLADAGIVRNRLKIASVIRNAKAVLEIKREHGSLDSLLWSFVDGKQIRNKWKSMKQIPASTPESDAMSKALKKQGLNFVGSTICYAFMQAVGMVNDHLVTCPRYREVGRL